MTTLTIHHSDHRDFPQLSERLQTAIQTLIRHEDKKKKVKCPVRINARFTELTFDENEFPTLHAFVYSG